MDAVTVALTVLQLLPSLVQTTTEVEQLIASTTTALQAAQSNGGQITDDQWNALNAQVAALQAQLG
jgi:uncharacterized alpha-E superfamily protein